MDTTSLPIAEFAFPGPLRDALVAAILRGDKTTTTGLHAEFARDGTPIPIAGELSVVVDSRGARVAVIKILAAEVKRLGDVGLQFAIDEGEGFATVEEWRTAHVRFFTSPESIAALGDPPVPIDDDTLVVCERFRLVAALA